MGAGGRGNPARRLRPFKEDLAVGKGTGVRCLAWAAGGGKSLGRGDDLPVLLVELGEEPV